MTTKQYIAAVFIILLVGQEAARINTAADLKPAAAHDEKSQFFWDYGHAVCPINKGADYIKTRFAHKLEKLEGAMQTLEESKRLRIRSLRELSQRIGAFGTCIQAVKQKGGLNASLISDPVAGLLAVEKDIFDRFMKHMQTYGGMSWPPTATCKVSVENLKLPKGVAPEEAVKQALGSIFGADCDVPDYLETLSGFSKYMLSAIVKRVSKLAEDAATVGANSAIEKQLEEEAAPYTEDDAGSLVQLLEGAEGDVAFVETIVVILIIAVVLTCIALGSGGGGGVCAGGRAY